MSIIFEPYAGFVVLGCVIILFLAVILFIGPLVDDSKGVWVSAACPIGVLLACLPLIIVIFTPMNYPSWGWMPSMCTWISVTIAIVLIALLSLPAAFITVPVFSAALCVTYGLWKMEDPGTRCVLAVGEGNAALVNTHKELWAKIAEDEAEVVKANEEMEQLSSEDARTMLRIRRNDIKKRIFNNMAKKRLTEDLALRIYATRCLEAAGVDVARDDIHREADSIMKEILQ